MFSWCLLHYLPRRVQCGHIMIINRHLSAIMVCALAPLSHNYVLDSVAAGTQLEQLNVMLRFHQVLRRASISRIACKIFLVMVADIVIIYTYQFCFYSNFICYRDFKCFYHKNYSILNFKFDRKSYLLHSKMFYTPICIIYLIFVFVQIVLSFKCI